jgi:hypothetical protein
VSNPCTSAGAPTGELETQKLEGVLGIWRATVKEGIETRFAGLDLFPVGKTGTFIEFTCGASKTPNVLSGGVIAVMSAGKMHTAETAKLGEAAGKQKPERFLGGEKQVLTKAGGEQVGLKVAMTQKYEEALEINTFF